MVDTLSESAWLLVPRMGIRGSRSREAQEASKEGVMNGRLQRRRWEPGFLG